MPHIQTHWDPKSFDLNTTQGNYHFGMMNSPLSVNLYPYAASLSRVSGSYFWQTLKRFKVLSQAYADVVKGWNWKSFTVLYEDEEGLMRLQDVIQLSTVPNYKVIVRQLPESNDYRLTNFEKALCPVLFYFDLFMFLSDHYWKKWKRWVNEISFWTVPSWVASRNCWIKLNKLAWRRWRSLTL